MSKQIAPTLRASMHYMPGRAGTRRVAESELRTLLRIARAAQKIRPYWPGWEDRCKPLFRAVDALDKVSK